MIQSKVFLIKFFHILIGKILNKFCSNFRNFSSISTYLFSDIIFCVIISVYLVQESSSKIECLEN